MNNPVIQTDIAEVVTSSRQQIKDYAAGAPFLTIELS